MGDTEYLLEQWGWWRLDGEGCPGYTSPSLALIRQALPQASTSNSYCISDERAVVVDRAVAKLSYRDKQLGDVIWLYYGAKWPMTRVAKYYGISEGKARELARAGAGWIDGFLSMLCAA